MIMKARNAAKPARTCHHSKNGSGLMMFAPSAGGIPHREQLPSLVWYQVLGVTGLRRTVSLPGSG